MLKPKPLASLRDLHLPEAVSWWPLAFGWYLLFALGILALVGLGIFLCKRHRDRQAARYALHLLARYEANYQKHDPAGPVCAQINELLKRVALAYFPRQAVASLHGQAWIDFLNQHALGLDFHALDFMLLDLPFQSRASADLKPLFSLAAAWIKQRKKPCLS